VPLDARAGVRLAGGRDDGITHAHGIRSPGLAGGDCQRPRPGENVRFNPLGIEENRRVVQPAARALQVQALGDRDSDDGVATRREERAQLLDGSRVRAGRLPDIEGLSQPKHVAPIQRCRWLEPVHRSVRAEDCRHRFGLGTPRRRPHGGDDRQFIEHNRRILNKSRVGQLIQWSELDHECACRSERRAIGPVLCASARDIDGLAVEKRQLAVRQAQTRNARDGGEHLREYVLPLRVAARWQGAEGGRGICPVGAANLWAVPDLRSTGGAAFTGDTGSAATSALSGWQRAASIGGPAIVVVLVAVAALWSGHVAVVSDLWVDHTERVALNVASVLQRLIDAETAERGYIATGDERFLGPYEGAAQDVHRSVATLRALTIDNPVQTPRIDSLSGLADRTFASLDSGIALRRNRGAPAAIAALAARTGLALMDSARTVISRIESEESRLLLLRRAATERQRQVTQIILLVGAAIAAMVGIAVNSALTSQQRQLAQRNTQLREQAAELQSQNELLHDQAIELEHQSDQVGQQAIELELANEQLQVTNDALSAANERLEAARLAAVHAQDAADHARLEAEAANAAKSTFLATMSHELRTPLNAITGYVDLLLAEIRGPLTAQQVSDLSRIRRAGTHLLGLINDVLNLAKLETRQVPFATDEVSLQETIANAATMVEPQAAAKGIAFSYAPIDQAVSVQGDRDKVLQIVLNLLANAIKFTPEGGRISLFARHAMGDGTVAITVNDTGRGIPPDQLARIFEPFVQVGRRTTGADAGAGLGLAISRELARSMNGEITVTSAEGAGSTFVVTLPATPAAGSVSQV
jgi:signal transduction histidine kinase